MDARRFARLKELGIPWYVHRDQALAEDLVEAPPASDAGSSASTSAATEQTAPAPSTAADAPAASHAAAAPARTTDRASDVAAASAGPEAAAETATALDDAGAALDWDALQSAVAGCERCRLCTGRTQTVFGVGDPKADLVVVGEGPGKEEDRRGEPFVGPAGQLLDAMLGAIGRTRHGAAGEGGVYIANVIKCRPPGNRDPRADEVAACGTWLRRQLALIAPERIVVVGRVAAQSLLESSEPLARLRNRLHAFTVTDADGTRREIPVHVTYHPAYLLRSPADKAKAWQDLKRIHAALASSST